MRIRRVEISAFRCFSERVVIEAIGDGITLLVGDNEEGKSTVLAALQTVLSEKHNVTGAVANSFLPYGSKVRPEIWLEFDLNGVGYRLHKAFCQKPAAELEAESGGRWTGDAAEEKIRELLEFTSPSRGKTKPDHRGLLALFWVEQGFGHWQPHINETAHSSLAGALDKEVGTVTGGERGRTLTKHIQERLSNNQTPKTRKPAGDYKDAKERVTELQGRHEDLSEKLRSFEEKVETLSQDRERLGNLEADDPIGSADARLSMAKKSVREVEGLEHNLKTSRANLKMANAQRALADTLVLNRNKDRNSVIAADQEVDELKNKQIAAEKVARNAKEAFNSAKKLHDGTKTDLATAQSNATTARRLADFLQHQSLFENARTRLKKAEKAESDATDLTAKANANLVTPEALEQLRELDANARDLNARLKAVATRLEFMPEGGRRARIDGKNIEEDALTLTEPTQIDLEDYGGIRVLPGGEDLVSRREAADKAVRELDGKCDKFGVTALQDATKQGNDRESWLNEAAIHRTVVDAQAPEGLEALREEVANLMAEAKNVEEDLGDTGTPDMKPSEASDRADELERKLSELAAAERQASDDLRSWEGKLGEANANFAVIAEQRGKAVVSAGTLRKNIEVSVKEASDKFLQEEFDNAVKMVERTSDEANKLESMLVDSDPDGARQEFNAATKAREKIGETLQELRQKIRELEIELRTLGQEDTSAEFDVVNGELERATVQEERLKHEVEALDLLFTTLVKEEQIARETFLGPVRDHIEPYLKRLFPGSDLVLNDQTLAITHLRRDGLDEPYERLSIGTREQLAVLARLAFADLLDSHGKQSPIILDDALVFSDDRRFEQMQRILDRAAERMQIIILTCHERSYFNSGWTTKRLDNCKD